MTRNWELCPFGSFHVWDVLSVGVQVWWFDEFGPKGTPVHRWLEEHLELISGVNAVQVDRYEATVQVMTRIRLPEEVQRDIAQLLADDPDFHFVLQQQLKQPSTFRPAIYLNGTHINPETVYG